MECQGNLPPSAAIKKKIGAPSVPQILGACGAPNGFKNVTRSIRIPNMCLVLKSDNGKVVSIANGQNHRWTDGQTDVTSSTVLVYRLHVMGLKLLN